jgi:hypothetical protein
MLKVSAALLAAFVAGLIFVGGLGGLGAEPFAPDPQAPAGQRPVIQSAAGDLPSYDRPVHFYCTQGPHCINHERSFCHNVYMGPGRYRRCYCRSLHRAC